jgi:lipopolysaccharide transport system permease protein
MLLQPMLQILGLWFFMAVVLRVRSSNHVPFTDYFLIGMVCWLMIAEVLQRNLTVLVEFAPLYQRSVFPMPLLPLVPLFLTGGIYSAVLIALAGILEGWRGAGAAAGFAPFLLTLLMYLTPVMYMPDLVPESVRPWLQINPLADLMALLHAAVQGLPWSLGNFVRPVLIGMLLWPFTWGLYRRAEPHMREAL